MIKYALLLLAIPLQLTAQRFTKAEITRWQAQAKQVTIIRDNWGIPHVYGKTDADCVFGLMYAQCEDDFRRMESNYIDILGRSAEIKGEAALPIDLYTKLVVDSAGAVADYKRSAPWLKKLLHAWADGMNYYLYKNPSVRPALLFRFEPWYPLMWTDGSIAAIQTGGVSADEVKSFYLGGTEPMARVTPPVVEEIHSGSNGFAIGPSRSASGNALLYINPHVSFYFRPEVHVISQEGLNAYGAITWGQFFVYQGFNTYCGWMHTSGYADVADVYAEQVVQKGDLWYYKYNDSLRPVKQQTITLRYSSPDGMKQKKVTTYTTHHGPVMAKRNGQWMSVRSNNRSLNALIQSWQRTKSKGFDSFKKNMELLSNSSNNTVFADNQGNIAYWHGNFIPRRDTSFNWSKPVDGSITATEWQGLHRLAEMIHLYNPASGWIQNCNSTPYTAAGESSPNKEDYPFYMATDQENFRGITAARLIPKGNAYTVDEIIEVGYNTYLSAFEQLIPVLVQQFTNTVTKNDSLYAKLIEPVATLKNWNLHSDTGSVATTLAIEWIEKFRPYINRANPNVDFTRRVQLYAANPPLGNDMVRVLARTVDDLTNKYGTWLISWGTINRYQRLSGDLQLRYDDSKPSLPVGMAASTWGCLPSFITQYFPNTQKRYGFNGNSFVCAVEFGKRIIAKSLLTGGESSDPSSPHFADQAEMYTKGQFKDVLFYKEDVLKHAERTYHPGEKK